MRFSKPAAFILSVSLSLGHSALAGADGLRCKAAFEGRAVVASPLLNLEGLTPIEVLNRLPQTMTSSSANISQSLDILARNLGISKTQADEWLNVFVSSGAFGGNLHARTLLSAGETATPKIRRSSGSGTPVLTKRYLKKIFSRYQGITPEAKNAADSKAVAMALQVMHGDPKQYTDEYRNQRVNESARLAYDSRYQNETDIARSNVLTVIGQANRQKAAILLSALYRLTLDSSINSIRKAAPGSVWDFAWNGANFRSTLSGLGGALSSFLGTAGLSVSGMAYITEGAVSSLATGSATTTAVGLGLLTIMHQIESYEFKRRTKFEKAMGRLKPQLLEPPQLSERSFKLEDLKAFELGDAPSTLTLPLRAELGSAELYAVLTNVDTAIELRSAVRRSLIIGKLASDTTEAAVERIQQVRTKAHQVALYLQGNQSELGSVLAKSKIENVLLNLEQTANALEQDLLFALDTSAGMIEIMRLAQAKASEPGFIDPDTIANIAFFKENLSDKAKAANASGRAALQDLIATLGALDRAYLNSGNRLLGN